MGADEMWSGLNCYNGGMNATESKQYVAKYLRSMENVERIKARELAALTDEEVWRQIQMLKTCEEAWRERPEWSGLIEQQALFHRRKKA
jgi:hypothetical protein